MRHFSGGRHSRSRDPTDIATDAAPTRGGSAVQHEESMSLKLRNLSVRSRFHLVMALVTLSLVVLAAWSAIAAHADLATVTTLFDQADATAGQVGALRESMATVRRYQAEMMATAVSNPTGVEAIHAAWKKEIAAVLAGGD